MPRTLKAFINEGVCSHIESDFNRIEVDGKTVWTADSTLQDGDLRLPELIQEIEQKAAEWEEIRMLGAARVLRRWAAWLKSGEPQ